jgi:hypothetical protein
VSTKINITGARLTVETPVAALRMFSDAATALDQLWDSDERAARSLEANYPQGWPDFADLVETINAWAMNVRKDVSK